MRTTNRLLIATLASALALGAAIPASAYPTPQRANAVRAQIDNLQRAVTRNDRRERISEREAVAVRRDISALQQTFRTYNRNGLSDGEFRALRGRIQAVRSRLRYERLDADWRRW